MLREVVDEAIDSIIVARSGNVLFVEEGSLAKGAGEV